SRHSVPGRTGDRPGRTAPGHRTPTRADAGMAAAVRSHRRGLTPGGTICRNGAGPGPRLRTPPASGTSLLPAEGPRPPQGLRDHRRSGARAAHPPARARGEVELDQGTGRLALVQLTLTGRPLRGRAVRMVLPPG